MSKSVFLQVLINQEEIRRMLTIWEETFRARKAIFSSSVSENEEVYSLKLLVRRETVHIKNL